MTSEINFYSSSLTLPLVAALLVMIQSFYLSSAQTDVSYTITSSPLINKTCDQWIISQLDPDFCFFGTCLIEDYEKDTECECAEAKCSCQPGYEGEKCDIETDFCADSPCGTFGNCVGLVNDYYCQCNSGFQPVNGSNKRCQAVNKCDPSLFVNETACLNNGRCINGDKIYWCNCTQDDKQYLITGQRCDSRTPRSDLQTFQITDISPKSGIAAGGFQLTIKGRNLNIIPVVIQACLLADGLEQLCSQDIFSVTSTEIVVKAPPGVSPTSKQHINRDLSVSVRYTGPYEVKAPSSVVFRYVDNPNITNILPKEVLVTGNVSLTAFGTNLKAVQTAVMNVTWITTEEVFGTIVSNPPVLSQSNCSGVEDQDAISCRLPPLNLPEKLQKLDLNNTQIMNSLRRNPGVAYLADGNTTATLYVGFLLDLQTTYKNVSKSLPNIKLSFTKLRIEHQKKGTIELPENRVLSVTGSGFTFGGLDEVDYLITLGLGSCDLESLTDNEIRCLAPETKPEKNFSRTWCNETQDVFPLVIHVTASPDEEPYFAYCVKYPTKNLALALGLGIGIPLFVLVVVIVIVIIVVCTKRRKKPKQVESRKDPISRWQYDGQKGQKKNKWQKQINSPDINLKRMSSGDDYSKSMPSSRSSDFVGATRFAHNADNISDSNSLDMDYHQAIGSNRSAEPDRNADLYANSAEIKYSNTNDQLNSDVSRQGVSVYPRSNIKSIYPPS